ncbi:MAG: hypothetical protein WCH11_05265, partial [Bdellovibrio sp.]
TRGSKGCVVVRNDVIQDLASHIETHQTPILIADDLIEVSESEYLGQRKRILGLFEEWRTAWQSHDIEKYIQFYDESFQNAEMDYQHWYRHKKKLKGTYKFIEVQLGSPLILKNKDQVVIRTLQHYRSDMHEDFGEKIIHAYDDEKTGFRIVREDWKPLPKSRFRLTQNPSTQHLQLSAPREPSHEKNVN